MLRARQDSEESVFINTLAASQESEQRPDLPFHPKQL